ncbi:MAG: hypothetical protein RIF32_14550, partial [Leptospirales bacterium]
GMMRCATPMYDNGHLNAPIVLANSNAVCTRFGEYKQWSFLYGLVPLGEPDLRVMFPDARNKYRITEEYTGWDAVGSIALGFFASVSRKTIVVENCGSIVPSDFHVVMKDWPKNKKIRAVRKKPIVKKKQENPAIVRPVQGVGPVECRQQPTRTAFSSGGC